MSRRRIPVVVSAALLCLMSGCEKDQSTTPSTTATSQPVVASSSAARPEHSRGRRRPGEGFDRRAANWWNDPATMLTHAALQDATVSEEQRDRIEALHGADQDAKGAMPANIRDFRKALADGVKAGKIDEKTFEAQFAAMQKAGEEARAARAKRLADLHAILTPEQRKAAADILRKRLEAGPRGMMAMDGVPPSPGGSAAPPRHHGPGPGGSAGMPGGGPMPGGSAGPHRGGPMPGGSSGMPHGGPMGGGMMGGMGEHRFEGPLGWLMMARGLDLTDEQQKQVDALAQKAEKSMPTKERREAMGAEFKTNMLAMLDAFEKAVFEPSALAIFKAPEKPEADWMKGHLEQLSAFIAILTQEQRDKLVERLSKPGDEWRKMDPGGPRPGYWNLREEEEPEK